MKLCLWVSALTSLIAGAACCLPAAAQNYPPPYNSQPPVYASPAYPGAPADDDDVIVPGSPRDPNVYGSRDPNQYGSRDPNVYGSRDPNVYGSRPEAPQPGAPYGVVPPGSVGTEEARQTPYGTTPPYGTAPGYGTVPPDGGAPSYGDAPEGGPVGSVRPPAGVEAPDDRPVATLPPEDQPENGEAKALPPQFRRQIVDYPTREQPGTIVIDTPNTYLYLVLGQGKALRYGIGVGREGFTWSGTERVRRMSEWPDWYPPVEMIQRQPYLPRMMAGGPGNPLGARALYLGNTVYRIHGTNQPSTIGQSVSSGCIRLTNEDVEDLYGRVTVGTKVVVLPGRSPASTANAAVPPVPSPVH
jgi:lipoprotein-anchoring transpeptidase ErfK/SrfK